MLNIPLMSNNIIKEDTDALIEFLKTSDRYTQGEKVREFETAWSEWLGVKHSLFVNSGSSANYITMAAVAEMYGAGEVIVGPIGWMSDVASIIAAGHKPVFVDVNLNTLGADTDSILNVITDKTRAVMLIHVLGANALTDTLIEELKKRNIPLIEDACESHGTTFHGRRVGSYGFASNFSFYYAHHMSTIEGGMICTNDDEFYQYIRMFRSHGMTREATDDSFRKRFETQNPDVYPEFLFAVPGFNMRSTELNAVIGLGQLKRLDKNVAIRAENFKLFLGNLDRSKYYTDFNIEGGSNYALIIMLRKADDTFYGKVCRLLNEENVEFRRGTAGGGNLARQPFVRKHFSGIQPSDYPNAEFVHKYGIYIGNYPDLEKEKILRLCECLNGIL